MSKKVLFSLMVMCVAALAFAGRASAQWSGAITVSGAIEPGTGGSPLGGTSVARCGSNVIVGFGDTESGNQFSFAGYATSADGGKTFFDRGVLPHAPGKTSFGADTLGYGGAGAAVRSGEYDGSVACGSASAFYYASVLTTGNAPCTDPQGCAAMAVSRSQNGGASWTLPVVIAASSLGTDQYIFPSVAVDPTNPHRVYLAYVNWNINAGNFGVPFCANSTGMFELFLAASADSGKTWSSKLVDHACTDTTSNPEELGDLVGPKVVISPGGKVYIVYEFEGFNGLPKPNEIRFTRSVDDGQTFSKPVLMSREAIFGAQPTIAVDRTLTQNRGTVYLSWSGAPIGTYTDVLVSDSTSLGVSFSFPRSISAAPATGTGRYQAKPVLGVDVDGQVADCLYETPTNAPSSSSAFSYKCGTSVNHGASWSLQRVASSAAASFSPTGIPTFFGYDSVGSDFLLANDGFFTAFELQSSTGQKRVVGFKADNP